eukprot:gene32667-9830_t
MPPRALRAAAAAAAIAAAAGAACALHAAAPSHPPGGERTVTVPAVDVAAAAMGRPLAGVKIDVEGAELGVLEALLPLLRGGGAPPFVLAEVSPQWWPPGGRRDGLSRCAAAAGRRARPHTLRRVGTRYATALVPLHDAAAVCRRARQEGRADVLFASGDADPVASSDGTERFVPCRDAVMHEGAACDPPEQCGFLRQKGVRNNKVWLPE